MAAEQARNLSLDGLRQKRARAVAQNLGQRIGKSSWLRELENISVGHGVSLLCWRSGGLEHPHDTPPYPFTPSPTFVHSSWSSLRLYTIRACSDIFRSCSDICGDSVCSLIDSSPTRSAAPYRPGAAAQARLDEEHRAFRPSSVMR